MLIVDLYDRAAVSQELVGGKAASLMHLASLHTNIPDGFCISTLAYTQHLNKLLREGNSLDLSNILNDVSIDMLPKLRSSIIGQK
jgi:phosphoenolpyruvate synthase/pyruvate phosphate dikinase